MATAKTMTKQARNRSLMASETINKLPTLRRVLKIYFYKKKLKKKKKQKKKQENSIVISHLKSIKKQLPV